VTVIRDTGSRALLPPFGEEHEELRQTVGRFVSEEDRAERRRMEARANSPRAVFALRRARLPRPQVPERYGGQGGTHLHDAVWVEELARSGASGGVAAGLNAHTSIAMPPIFNFGSRSRSSAGWSPHRRREDRRPRDHEPGAGSDVASISTTARRVDGGYCQRPKTFITNGVRADFLVCACRTTEEGGHEGISFLVLEREMPGYQVTRQAGEDGLALIRHWRAVVHRRRGAGGELLARRTAASADHGQLRLGAAADGDRAVGAMQR